MITRTKFTLINRMLKEIKIEFTGEMFSFAFREITIKRNPKKYRRYVSTQVARKISVLSEKVILRMC